MEWMIYLIGGIAIAGAALAIYERRKNLRMRYDGSNQPPQDRNRAAFSSAEQIRAEDAALHRPGNSSPF